MLKNMIELGCCPVWFPLPSPTGQSTLSALLCQQMQPHHTISSPFFSEVPASFAELGSFYKRANIMHKDFLTHFVCQHQISIILPWHAIKFVQSAHNHFYMAIPPDHKRLGLERLNIWAGLSHHFWSSFSCDDFPLDCPTCQLSRSLLSSCHLTWEPWDKGTSWPSI